MNASRVIGPVIGAVAYQVVGPSWVFVGNTVTYLFVVGALMMVVLPVLPKAVAPASRWRELTAGITAAREDKVVGRCLVTVFLFSLLALAFIGQMPVVAAHNLGINPKSANYGILYASFGTGTLLGAISIGTVFTRTSKAMIVRVCLIGYAIALSTFALLPRSGARLLRGGRGGGVLLRLHHRAEHDDAGPLMTPYTAGSWPCGSWASAARLLWVTCSSGPWSTPSGFLSPTSFSSERASPSCWPGTPTSGGERIKSGNSEQRWPNRHRATASCTACRFPHAACAR